MPAQLSRIILFLMSASHTLRMCTLCRQGLPGWTRATREAFVLRMAKAKPYKRKVAAIVIATAAISFPLMIVAFRALT